MDSAEQVLHGLDDEQRLAAFTLTGPLCILAGAGTGKTRAITHRIAYGVRSGVYDPHRVLAVTFTARAAAEMRSRLTSLGAPGVQARTFHAAALRQLQYFWPISVGGQMPQILEHKIRLIAEACQRLRITTDRASLRDFASEVEWAKVSTITATDYPVRAAHRPGPAGLDHLSFARLYQAYEDLKQDRHVIDFEDVLLLTAGMLSEDERVAAQVRSQYRHFVVDEYQDVSPLQQRLLDLWLGGREELCVVGDAAQTIYSFTGATPDYLLNFRRQHPEAEVVKLVRDYRSTPQVVRLANVLLEDRSAQQRQIERRAAASGHRPGSAEAPVWPTPLQLISQRASGPAPEITEHSDDDAEAAWIAQRIQQRAQAGIPLSEMAVLYRTNGQSQAFEQALASAGVSYQLRGSERFFSRREVREAMAALRTSALVDAEEPVGESVRAVLSSLGWSQQGPGSAGAVRERWESMSALVALADQLVEERVGFTMRDFTAELEERSAAQHAPTVEGVTLSSLHSAKGLEWDVVFLAGLCEGLSPITFAQTQREVDEERRLLYVGITRARQDLYLSYAAARHTGGRGRRKPSRFLAPLRKELGLGAPTQQIAPGQRKLSPNAAARRRVVTCATCEKPLVVGREIRRRRCEECPPRYDAELFEALRAWRLEYAKELGRPAFMVFADAELEVIAERKPAPDDDELLKIPGIGEKKLATHGEGLKEVLRAHTTDRA